MRTVEYLDTDYETMLFISQVRYGMDIVSLFKTERFMWNSKNDRPRCMGGRVLHDNSTMNDIIVPSRNPSQLKVRSRYCIN